MVASIRHLDTDYDRLLMSGVPRMEARDLIRPTIDRNWSDSVTQLRPVVCLVH